MRLALYQGPGVSGRPDENREIMRRIAVESAARGSALVIFPELFASGYNLGDKLFDLAEAADGATAKALTSAAREAGIAILAGYPEREAEKIYNAAMLIAADGTRLANARKTHLFGAEEKRIFAPGQDLTLTPLGNLRLGILICYDVEFPEATRALALAGAQLLAVPTALMRPYERVAEGLVPIRAYENQLFVAYANRCGREGDLDYCGASCIIAPDGSELARAGTGEELLIAELQPAAFAASRQQNPYLADRRPDLYQKLAAIADGQGGKP